MAESDVIDKPVTKTAARTRSPEGQIREFGAFVQGEALPRPRPGSSTEEMLSYLTLNLSGDHCGGTK